MPTRSPRQRWHYFRRHLRRWLQRLLAVLLMVLGMIVFPMPIPLGLVLMALGAGLLLASSRGFSARVKRLRLRYPRMNLKLAQVETKLPRWLRRALRKTAPDYGRKPQEQPQSDEQLPGLQPNARVKDEQSGPNGKPTGDMKRTWLNSAADHSIHYR